MNGFAPPYHTAYNIHAWIKKKLLGIQVDNKTVLLWDVGLP